MASKTKDDLVKEIEAKLPFLTKSNLRAVLVTVENAVKAGRSGCGANRHPAQNAAEPSPRGAPREPRITFAA